MKKQKEQPKRHEIYQFEDHCHLWNIVPGGKGNGIVMLRKIVDSILNTNYDHPHNKLPSIILVGEEGAGKKFVARALANSLTIEGIRECPARYFENGYFSHQFFNDSTSNTLHLITDIQQLNEKAEATLWKYMKSRQCSYYNSANRVYDNTVYCNGMIVMTGEENKDKVSESILKAATHVIELEPLNADQLEAALHQLLAVFCGIEYGGQDVLKAIIYHGIGKIGSVIRFLKHCLILMKAEMKDCLTMELVNKASRISPMAVPPSAVGDDIPF